jgi:hypothetical protein
LRGVWVSLPTQTPRTPSDVNASCCYLGSHVAAPLSWVIAYIGV